MIQAAGKLEEIAAGSHILVISNKILVVYDDISDDIHSTRSNKGGVSICSALIVACCDF